MPRLHNRPPPPMTPLPPLRLHLLLLVLLVAVYATRAVDPGSCGGPDSCGDLVLPFPFHLNSSCSSAGTNSSRFRLSCDANATLTLPLGSATFRVLAFLPSGSLLLDYAPASPSPCDAAYAPFSRPTSPAAKLDAAPFLAVTQANVLRLYACEDSSLCRAGCDDVATCGRVAGGGKSGCCYPLSDGSVWKAGNALGVFADFGCRGFSSWIKNRSAAPGAAWVVRGIEVEWAVPRGSAMAKCADSASLVNATAVRDSVRCACAAGLVGDGFAQGTGCSKGTTCSSDGQASDGRECCQGRFCSKKAVALAGFFVSLFFLAAAVSFWLFLRQPSKDSQCHLDPACIPKIFRSVCDAKQFTYEQLEEATNRFDSEKAVDSVDGTVHAGVLDDGSLVAVQRVGYETQGKLRLVLDRIELLSEISHRNIAHVVGFCLDSSNALLLVHEHFAGGTLEDHLRQIKCRVLSWFHRVNIAIELASALTYLQAHETAPTFVHDLKSSDIFLDSDFTAKIAGYKLTRSATYYSASYEHDVVFNFGHLLIELLTGLRQQMPFDSVAPKVREGRLHEVIDPTLLSGKQLPASHDEVSEVFELAVRCLSSAENGLCMLGVAKELMHIRRDNGSSSKIEISLEETFSNSSLLQMISMSPDTLHLHLP
ncbi:probably inactive receptor-like protein kinase At2g46850 isoform X2 [Phragmites australis]|uniref:probably inactive receptor-like protein kinase At2g46850 isoform X2 n=1 Tax=Phragmites australis TaxID=29695 RepID=UPI002D78326F|nr:probably inactive receptor-like protein kinase At2g46850 isoform X2 [Phragmites australis]